MIRSWWRCRTEQATAMVLSVLCLGFVGVMVVLEVVLLTMRLPATAAGRAWRMLGLTSASTALLFGISGVVVLLVVDRGQPVLGPVVYGMFFVIPGALVGALVGSVLWLDVYRREVKAR